MVSDDESGLAVSVSSDFADGPGQLLTKVTKHVGDDNQQWALRGLFAKFTLRSPAHWQIKSLVLGSAHLNNLVASKKKGITGELLYSCFWTKPRPASVTL